MKREAAVLIFAALFPSAAAATYFFLLPASNVAGHANPAVQTVYGGSKVIQFLLPVLYLYCVDRAAFAKFRFTRRGVVLGIAFGLVVAAAIVWLANMLAPTVLAAMPERVRQKVNEFGCGTPAKFIGLAVFLSVIHSFLEEYYWRWFFFDRLRRFWSFTPAAIVSGLGFMGHHVLVLAAYLPGRFFTAVVPFSLGIAVGGIVWAWLFELSQSLVGPWLSHLLVDAALMYVGYRMVFGG